MKFYGSLQKTASHFSLFHHVLLPFLVLFFGLFIHAQISGAEELKPASPSNLSLLKQDAKPSSPRKKKSLEGGDHSLPKEMVQVKKRLKRSSDKAGSTKKPQATKKMADIFLSPVAAMSEFSPLRLDTLLGAR